MAKRAGSRHRQVGARFPLVTWDGTQDDSLQHHNVLEGNDLQLQQVWQHYCADLKPAGWNHSLARSNERKMTRG